jgi:hydrogenase maturation protease
MKTLVIGYGNTLRGDDGVGIWVAEQVAAQNWSEVRSLAVHQLTPELAVDLAQAEVVFFIDAWIGEDTQVQPQLKRLFPDPTGTTCDHSWNPSVLLALTQTLYNHDPIAYQWLIPAVQFEYGEPLSAIARDGADWVIAILTASINSKSDDITDTQITANQLGSVSYPSYPTAIRSPPPRSRLDY